MIVTEKDIEKNLMTYYSCNNPMEVGQKYEKNNYTS